MKKLLYAIADSAEYDVYMSDGSLLMDVLILRCVEKHGVPFEMADAGVRLAIDEGWLVLKDGMIVEYVPLDARP